MTTLTVLIAAVRNRCNLPSGDARVTDADITDFINQAIHDAEAEHDWPWREAIEDFSVTADDNTYTPDAAWRTTLSLTMVDPSIVLIKKNWKWTRRLAFEDLRGLPQYYTEYAGTIYIYPIPDEAYTLQHRYLTQLTALVNGSDTVGSPDWFDRAIISKASSYVAQKLRDSEHYQMFESEYKKQIQTARDDVSRSYEPVQVETREDW